MYIVMYVHCVRMYIVMYVHCVRMYIVMYVHTSGGLLTARIEHKKPAHKRQRPPATFLPARLLCRICIGFMRTHGEQVWSVLVISEAPRKPHHLQPSEPTTPWKRAAGSRSLGGPSFSLMGPVHSLLLWVHAVRGLTGGRGGGGKCQVCYIGSQALLVTEMCPCADAR